MTYQDTIKISTKGFCDLVDITQKVSDIVFNSEVKEGIVTVFISGSTAWVTTIEYESGAIEDFQETMERLVPQNADYHHNAKWGDGNGFSHIRASLIGPSISIPIYDREMTLGAWQQIVVADFDNCSRQREVVAQVVGEK
ncbi:secondary thiamine-phosphate synthase enzyme YjbQ [Patescibacteria group bacterium]|nr:secondary thiamine-phosphate synthase enzyme YjbQ [Patescibacteria group bacterium]